jgi:hypothetical protein
MLKNKPTVCKLERTKEAEAKKKVKRKFVKRIKIDDNQLKIDSARPKRSSDSVSTYKVPLCSCDFYKNLKEGDEMDPFPEYFLHLPEIRSELGKIVKVKRLDGSEVDLKIVWAGMKTQSDEIHKIDTMTHGFCSFHIHIMVDPSINLSDMEDESFVGWVFSAKSLQSKCREIPRDVLEKNSLKFTTSKINRCWRVCDGMKICLPIVHPDLFDSIVKTPVTLECKSIDQNKNRSLTPKPETTEISFSPLTKGNVTINYKMKTKSNDIDDISDSVEKETKAANKRFVEDIDDDDDDLSEKLEKELEEAAKVLKEKKANPQKRRKLSNGSNGKVKETQSLFIQEEAIEDDIEDEDDHIPKSSGNGVRKKWSTSTQEKKTILSTTIILPPPPPPHNSPPTPPQEQEGEPEHILPSYNLMIMRDFDVIAVPERSEKVKVTNGTKKTSKSKKTDTKSKADVLNKNSRGDFIYTHISDICRMKANGTRGGKPYESMYKDKSEDQINGMWRDFLKIYPLLLFKKPIPDPTEKMTLSELKTYMLSEAGKNAARICYMFFNEFKMEHHSKAPLVSDGI